MCVILLFIVPQPSKLCFVSILINHNLFRFQSVTIEVSSLKSFSTVLLFLFVQCTQRIAHRYNHSLSSTLIPFYTRENRVTLECGVNKNYDTWEAYYFPGIWQRPYLSHIVCAFSVIEGSFQYRIFLCMNKQNCTVLVLFSLL